MTSLISRVFVGGLILGTIALSGCQSTPQSEISTRPQMMSQVPKDGPDVSRIDRERHYDSTYYRIDTYNGGPGSDF